TSISRRHSHRDLWLKHISLVLRLCVNAIAYFLPSILAKRWGARDPLLAEMSALAPGPAAAKGPVNEHERLSRGLRASCADNIDGGSCRRKAASGRGTPKHTRLILSSIMTYFPCRSATHN